MTDDADAHEVYGELAADYAENNPESEPRAEYEWPVVKALLPPLAGTRVLDAGCGPGYYSAWMARQGAEVVGVDASERMLSEARERYGDEVRFREANLREPLPFEDGAFELVVSQLTLEHVEDWRPPLREFGRVLRSGGRVVLSCDHPFTTYHVIEVEDPEVGSADATEADYYETERYDRVWNDEQSPGDPVEMPCYRRPLHGVLDPLFEAGFVLEALREPRPPTEEGPLGYFDEHTPRFLALRGRTRCSGE
jgi:SAM-dependent methyltransferase